MIVSDNSERIKCTTYVRRTPAVPNVPSESREFHCQHHLRTSDFHGFIAPVEDSSDDMTANEQRGENSVRLIGGFEQEDSLDSQMAHCNPSNTVKRREPSVLYHMTYANTIQGILGPFTYLAMKYVASIEPRSWRKPPANFAPGSSLGRRWCNGSASASCALHWISPWRQRWC